MKMKRLYETMMDQMKTGVAVIDPRTDLFVLMNPAYAYYLGIPCEGAVSFSRYHSLLGVPNVSGLFQVSSSYNLTTDNVPETTEILLPVNDVERCFTHFFAEFNDYTGKKLVLSVLTDVSELKKIQETLLLARDAAESASRAKSSFLANMSHEIRTPMNGILGLIDLLADSHLDPQQQQYIDLVRGSTNALLLVINDILDHSKIEAGKLLIETYEFDLRQLIRELSISFSHSAEQKSLKFQTPLLSDVSQFIQGDANRLRQVLGNFLSNAIKFSTTGGTVKLHVASVDDPRKSGWLRFEVSDTGIGITETQMAQLFKPFEQADTSTSRKFGGTGLGLAISKKLIQLMGGEIGCYSNYGAGSVFWCELPLPTSSGQRSGIVEHSNNSNTAPASGSKPLTILLVDDVHVNLIVLSAVLQQWGHVTETAENGVQALELLEKNQYDLVFMDCQMPKMDGYECTQRVRDSQTKVMNPKVPIIAVTAHAMVGDKERCLASGMDDYISKPIDHGELQSKLTKWAPK
jgi:signal transduction histidine kinase/CheY-like chemotaxis protein